MDDRVSPARTVYVVPVSGEAVGAAVGDAVGEADGVALGDGVKTPPVGSSTVGSGLGDAPGEHALTKMSIARKAARRRMERMDLVRVVAELGGWSSRQVAVVEQPNLAPQQCELGTESRGGVRHLEQTLLA